MAAAEARAIGAVERDGACTIIAGPCSVESREQMREVAGTLKELGIKVMLVVRTSRGRRRSRSRAWRKRVS